MRTAVRIEMGSLVDVFAELDAARRGNYESEAERDAEVERAAARCYNALADFVDERIERAFRDRECGRGL